jgi:hypothetical protein
MPKTMTDLEEYLSELKHDQLMAEHELFCTLSEQGYMNYGGMQKARYHMAEMIFKKALKEAGEVL